MAVPFERRDQLGQERHQPLAADAVGRTPRAGQRFLDVRPALRRSWAAERLRRLDRAEEQANRVLALLAGGRDELVEDDRTLRKPSGSIAWRNLDQQLAFGPEAHR